MVLNQFKIKIQFFLLPNPVLLILMGWSLFSQVQQAPDPDFRMIGESLVSNQKEESIYLTIYYE